MRSIAHIRTSDATEPTLNSILAACSRVSSVVEPAGSEVFLDLSSPGCRGAWQDLRQDLAAIGKAALGLATSKLVARIASGIAVSRPDAVCAAHPGKEAAFLAPLPVQLLWMAQPAVREQLHRLGYQRIGQLAAAPPQVLQQRFGTLGRLLLHWSHGLDPTPVMAKYPPRSVSHRIHLGDNPSGQLFAIAATVRKAAHEVASQLAAAQQGCRALSLRLISVNGVCSEKQYLSPGSRLCSAARLERAALRLLNAIAVSEPVGEVTVTAAQLVPLVYVQSELFAPPAPPLALLDDTAEYLRNRFGAAALQTAAALKPPRRELFMAALERSWLE